MGRKLVVSDGHEGSGAAAAKVLEATWQRCRAHFMRGRAGLRTEGASGAWSVRPLPPSSRKNRPRTRTPSGAWRPTGRPARPAARQVRQDRQPHGRRQARGAGLHGLPPGALAADPQHQPAGATERRDQAPHENVVGIFPDDRAITRLVGAMLLEQSDEWALQRRYIQLEGLPDPQRYCTGSPADCAALSTACISACPG